MALQVWNNWDASLKRKKPVQDESELPDKMKKKADKFFRCIEAAQFNLRERDLLRFNDKRHKKFKPLDRKYFLDDAIKLTTAGILADRKHRTEKYREVKDRNFMKLWDKYRNYLGL